MKVIPCSKLTMLSPCILHLLVQFILLIRLLTILEESVIMLPLVAVEAIMTS